MSCLCPSGDKRLCGRGRTKNHKLSQSGLCPNEADQRIQWPGRGSCTWLQKSSIRGDGGSPALSPDSVPIPSLLCPSMGPVPLGPGSQWDPHSWRLVCAVATTGGSVPLWAVTLEATLCRGENRKAEVGRLPGLRASPLQHASSIHVLPFPSGITSGPDFREVAAYLPKPISGWATSQPVG